MTLHTLDMWRKTAAGKMRRLRDNFERTTTPPPLPPSPKPWYSHIDSRDRGAPHPGTGFAPFDAFLKDSLAKRGKTVPTGPVGQFIHGYSGSSLPTTFAASSVASAQNLGIGAMLNVKRPWTALANGTYDAQIASLFNSWPVSVPGEVTINHEPENDTENGGPGVNNTSAASVQWALTNGNAQIWKNGLNRFIDVAAPIIRNRGLNVKVGGVLMDFSWDSGTFNWWNWWDEVTPANLNEVAFGIDIYSKTLAGPVWKDLTPRINQLLSEVRSVGIGSMSFWETAIDRRSSLSSQTAPIIGTEASTTAGWDAYYQIIQKIPEMRMVCYFHLPTGPASAQSYLTGTSIDKFADIAMQGRRVS